MGREQFLGALSTKSRVLKRTLHGEQSSEKNRASKRTVRTVRNHSSRIKELVITIGLRILVSLGAEARRGRGPRIGTSSAVRVNLTIFPSHDLQE